jgi:FkbM family methyltransferase
MKKFQKFKNNLLSGSAVSVLGPVQYLGYLARFLVNIPRILRAGDFRPLDKSMSMIAKQFNYRGSTFLFDCKFCDEHLEEDSFGFGIVREIYIRDCYFKWHPPSVYDRAMTIIDLGANRGAFSTLMTTRAKFILSVECGEQYVPIIRHNMSINNFTNYAVETAFIGAGGSNKSNLPSESNLPRITINDLLHRHNIESVDLIKLDIEGSEFALFDSADWLRRVNAISMEVHPLYGDPNAILKSINKHGFAYAIADENLQCINDAKQASFIYAWKNA